MQFVSPQGDNAGERERVRERESTVCVYWPHNGKQLVLPVNSNGTVRWVVRWFCGFVWSLPWKTIISYTVCVTALDLRTVWHLSFSDGPRRSSSGYWLTSHRGDPGSRLGLIKWDLWWKKWRWGRFSPRTSVSPTNLHLPNSPSSQSPGARAIGQKWPTCRMDPVWNPSPTVRI
jgi:hypothetical protein